MTDYMSSVLVRQGKGTNLTAVCTEHNQRSFDAADMMIAYLEALDIEFVYGLPGGNIEPFYDALLRSERRGGPKPVLARHETGAAFMADGYARNSGKIGVCCATTGPGTTNLITGVSSAYENNIPLLVITAQTSLQSFGRNACQESSDTGVNTVGMFQYCTGYNSLVSHVAQLERKLVAAITTAIGKSCPVHLSIPLDIMRSAVPNRTPIYDIVALSQTPKLRDDAAIGELCHQMKRARQVVFVLGSGCLEAVAMIITVAFALRAKIVTTIDGKGLISPYHPLFYGVIGFGGHQSAEDVLCDFSVDTVVAVGTTLSELQSNGWDQQLILNDRLIHIDPLESNLSCTPMARLQVKGSIFSIFEVLLENIDSFVGGINREAATKKEYRLGFDGRSSGHLLEELGARVTLDQKIHREARVKPQWLMFQLGRIFPPHTKYLVDNGNSLVWAVHCLHPIVRRLVERRPAGLSDDGGSRFDNDRRKQRAGWFQTAVEFASMGWAIGASIGASMACPRQPIVCITGDGSMLMSGQEITVALEQQLPIVFVVLNDSSLGMVRHGQSLGGAEVGANTLPSVDFRALAAALGVRSRRITCAADLLDLDVGQIFQGGGPMLLDVLIDQEEVPPIGVRVNTLKNS
jgi:acetolactate synthase-1/2/3 large subunit